ncbi:MAG: RNA polymerase sigma factor [Phycisphaerales bacterium]
MDRDEELRLIERARGGDPSAIEGLVRRYQGSLHAFLLRRCGRPELAEDLVQESFVRVLRSLDRFDPRFRFSTWLFTIGRRLMVNHFQKMRPAYDSEVVEGRSVEDAPPARDILERERRESILGAVEHALEGLNPSQRRIVRMFHEQGRSIQNIAGELGLPEGTIKSHLHRARRRMQEAIAAEPATHRRALEALGIDDA